MPETVDIKTGEVIAETALIPRAGMESLVKTQDLPLLSVMEQLDTLDWSKLKPHYVALLLMQKPLNAGGGVMYLTFKQALIMAYRCAELNLSPFSSEVWFNINTSSVNITTEGRKRLARNQGIDLGPPQLEEVKRPWPSNSNNVSKIEELKKLGFNEDLGIKCRVRVGDPKHQEHAEYTAYLSEWMMVKSPVWRERPMHMLQTRAYDKTLSLAMGTGISDSID